MKTVKKALTIFDCFTKNEHELGVTEIATHLGFHKSTTHSLLSTLKEDGYVIYNPITRKYSLGYKLLELADHIIFKKDLRDICLPIMNDLMEELQEDVSLNIKNETSRVCIAVARGPQHVRLDVTLGMSIPLYCGAAGKCLLAFTDEEKIKNILDAVILKKFTNHTIVNRKNLLKQLEQIRKQGFAESREEYFKDAAAMAFPLFDNKGSIIAAYSIHSTVNRLKESTKKHFVKKGLASVQRTNEILKRINY